MNASQAIKIYLTAVPRVARDIKWIMLWDENQTIIQNCRNLRIPNAVTGHNLCYKFKLGFKEGFHRRVKTNKECLDILIKNGLSQSEVARILGVSPQRIQQILNKKG